jgi:predicted ATPase
LLIGPNGSGKSNFMEAISLMRSTPKDMREVTRNGGGVEEWVWKVGPKAGTLLPFDPGASRQQMKYIPWWALGGAPAAGKTP